MAEEHQIRTKLIDTEYRVAIFGGDNRVHALDSDDTSYGRDIHVTTYCSSEAEASQLAASLKMGSFTHVILLTRWMGHTNYKAVKAAANQNNVTVIAWQKGLGTLKEHLPALIRGEEDGDEDDGETTEVPEEPPVQVKARDAGVSVACFESRHDDCPFKGAAIVRCGCSCHPRAEVPEEPVVVEEAPYTITDEQLLETINGGASMMLIIERLRAFKSSQRKVIRERLEDLVSQGKLQLADNRYAVPPPPSPAPPEPAPEAEEKKLSITLESVLDVIALEPERQWMVAEISDLIGAASSGHRARVHTVVSRLVELGKLVITNKGNGTRENPMRVRLAVGGGTLETTMTNTALTYLVYTPTGVKYAGDDKDAALNILSQTPGALLFKQVKVRIRYEIEE